jgi:hypothetical protein
MGSRVLLLLLAACGQVEKLPVDAAIDAAPDAFSCPAMETICGTSCCVAGQGCNEASNVCIDATASCANIKIINPNAPSGPYIHSSDNAQFFCDMSKSPVVQYDALAMGRYNAPYTGYTIVNGAELSDPVIQQAFIWAFNKQGGMPALETWTAGNVCTTQAAAGGTRLEFAGSLLFPSQGQAQAGTSYTAGMLYGEDLVNHNPPIFMVAPLPTSFFTMYPASGAVNCADSNNPALFFKSHN